MKLSLIALIAIVSTSAFAFPEGKFDALARAKGNRNKSAVDSPLFEGIVKLSNCSGALIQLEGQSDDAKAIIMTNGHCIQKPGGYLNPGEVWVNVPKVREIGIYTDAMELKRTSTTKIIYATMTGTDVALYELGLTYAQIRAQFGIDPLSLASTRLNGTERFNIPSGYWDRNWACNAEGFAFSLREGAWTFTDSIRYNQECDTIGGTSGSPIVQDGTRTVIAINNTSNESGERCTLNNPCEVDEAGNVVVISGRSYGQQTYQFYGCMNASFALDLTLSTCELAKP